MTEQEIISAIERIIICGEYFIWTIGVTDNPAQPRGEQGIPTHWYQWDAGTEEVARRIEKYFLDKGCREAGGGGLSPKYVYLRSLKLYLEK